MNGLPWFRLYHSWLYSPSIQALPDRHKLRWIQLLTLFSEHHTQYRWVLRGWVGALPPWWRVGLSLTQVTRLLGCLPDLEVRYDDPAQGDITLVFVNYERLQTTNAHRQAAYRQRGGHTSPSRLPSRTPGGVVTERLERVDRTPLPPIANDDCGHTEEDPTYPYCSDRHFVARRAWMNRQRVNGQDPDPPPTPF